MAGRYIINAIRHCAALLVLFVGSGGLPAQAFSQDDMADIIQLNVHSGWRAEHRHFMALEFELADGWKTYWRAPNGIGIPPRIKIQTPSVKIERIVWPVPDILDYNGYRGLGYKKSLALPLVLSVSNAGDIAMQGTIEIGVCKDVCIPVTLHFDGVLSASGAVSYTIQKMMQDIPIRAKEKAICRTRAHQDGIELYMDLPVATAGFSAEAIGVIEVAGGNVFAGLVALKRATDRLSASAVLEGVDPGPVLFARQDIRFTLIENGQALEILGCVER